MKVIGLITGNTLDKHLLRVVKRNLRPTRKRWTVKEESNGTDMAVVGARSAPMYISLTSSRDVYSLTHSGGLKGRTGDSHSTQNKAPY